MNKNSLTSSDYKLDDKIYWWWNDVDNIKPIEMTVALPAINAEKIIWLALESLKNQTNINFAWELICSEEFGKSRDIIKSYVGKLPGCVRIVHKIVDPTKGKYNIGRYTLLEKWIDIANLADNNSKIYVKHACDCYSPPKRLYIHYEHFKNPTCCYSTQPKGYFYNIIDDKFFLYDGSLNQKLDGNHLNMALRMDLMKKVPLPKKPLFAGIDGYIFRYITNMGLKINNIISTDNTIDPNNWKQSLDTDGYNNISVGRRKGYDIKIADHIIPTPKNKVMTDLDIPSYIFDRLKLLSKKY